MYPDVFTPTQSFHLSYSSSSLVSPHHNIYTQHFVMLNKPNLLSVILYIRLFVPLTTLVALCLHAGSQGKEKQAPRGVVDTSLQPPAHMLSCNCNVPLQCLLTVLTQMIVKWNWCIIMKNPALIPKWPPVRVGYISSGLSLCQTRWDKGISPHLLQWAVSSTNHTGSTFCWCPGWS